MNRKMLGVGAYRTWRRQPIPLLEAEQNYRSGNLQLAYRYGYSSDGVRVWKQDFLNGTEFRSRQCRELFLEVGNRCCIDEEGHLESEQGY